MSADGTPPPSTIAVRLDTLLESPWQPHGRSKRDLDGLVASIKIHGITSRLLVRRRPNHGELEIIAGHRTRAAALLAGVEEAEARVLEGLGDDDARELFYVTNAHREDLTPLEEAEFFDGMLKSGWSIGRVAERSGKTLATVNKRLVLLRLVEAARKALDDRKILMGVAEHLALLPPSEQEGALLRLTTGEDPAPRRVALTILQSYQRSLADVPWELGDTDLLREAGACTNCPKRTGAQLPLLGEVVDTTDRCLDGACFDAKGKAHEADNPEDDEQKPRTRSRPAKSDPPPPGPVTHVEPPAPPPDFEALAEEATIKRVTEAIAEAALRKRKIDGMAWRFLLGLFARSSGVFEVDEVVARRIGPGLTEDRALQSLVAAINEDENDAHVFSIGVELAVRCGAADFDLEDDDSIVRLAARQFKIDVDEIHAEELKRLRKEAKKSAPTKVEPAKPAPAEEPEPKCRVCGCTGSRRCGTGEEGGLCAWVDENEDLCSECAGLMDEVEARLEMKPRPEKEVIKEVRGYLEREDFSAARVKAAIGELLVRERLVLELGDGERKIGLPRKQKVSPPPRAPKVGGAPDERSEVDDAAVKGQHGPALMVTCPRCNAKPGQPCNHPEGGTHERRVRAAAHERHERAEASPERSPEEQAARARSVKTTVHLLVKVPTGKRGKPPIKKLCEAGELPVDVVATNHIADVTCEACRARDRARQGLYGKEMGL